MRCSGCASAGAACNGANSACKRACRFLGVSSYKGAACSVVRLTVAEFAARSRAFWALSGFVVVHASATLWFFASENAVTCWREASSAHFRFFQGRRVKRRCLWESWSRLRCLRARIAPFKATFLWFSVAVGGVCIFVCRALAVRTQRFADRFP